jgi:diaminopropionate ammonia-lyase
MAGLNCGTLSSLAWPHLAVGIDVFTVVSNDNAFEAMRLLATDGIVSGESGAAGVAGLLALVRSDEGRRFLDSRGGPQSISVLAISTEGITDPVMYRRVVGR